MSEQLIDDCQSGSVPAETEKAYRRGFMQGAAVTLSAVETGVTLAMVHKWLYGPLAAWRRKGASWKQGSTVKAAAPPSEPAGPIDDDWQRYRNMTRGARVCVPA